MQKKVVPMFHVPDVRTVDWYRDLGFDVTATYGDNAGGLSFAMVSFGAGEVMFSSGGRLSAQHRRDVDLYAYTEEVDRLYDRIKAGTYKGGPMTALTFTQAGKTMRFVRGI